MGFLESRNQISEGGGMDLGGVTTVLLPEWHLSRGWQWLQGRQSAMAEATYLPLLILLL